MPLGGRWSVVHWGRNLRPWSEGVAAKPATMVRFVRLSRCRNQAGDDAVRRRFHRTIDVQVRRLRSDTAPAVKNSGGPLRAHAAPRPVRRARQPGADIESRRCRGALGAVPGRQHDHERSRTIVAAAQVRRAAFPAEGPQARDRRGGPQALAGVLHWRWTAGPMLLEPADRARNSMLSTAIRN